MRKLFVNDIELLYNLVVQVYCSFSILYTSSALLLLTVFVRSITRFPSDKPTVFVTTKNKEKLINIHLLI